MSDSAESHPSFWTVNIIKAIWEILSYNSINKLDYN